MSLSEGGRPPSVDHLAHSLEVTGLPHPTLVRIARAAIAEGTESGDLESIPRRAAALAAAYRTGLLQPVINATGVLLHTNLGRAPLGVERAAGYSNLEFDLGTGRRGNRSAHAAGLVAQACGAEAALVVNNGAAALHLVLATLASGGEVVVSRGELVEIGGGFRIPEVMTASGARLVEVGTTNRTRLDDYERAVGPDTRVVLKVHTSNYRISGFVSSVAVRDMGRLGAGGLPVVADLGSGLLDARCPWLRGGPPSWLAGEPAVRQTLDDGAALVTFSGDKLLGGPQAGVIAGRADLVDRCRRHPLSRVVRPGGLVLSALQDVANAYLRRDAEETLPLWRMATTSVDDLRRRAERITGGQVVDCESVMGGGTLPGETIPSAGVGLPGDLCARLRSAAVPVVARVSGDTTVCDLRTVQPEQDEALAGAVAEALAG